MISQPRNSHAIGTFYANLQGPEKSETDHGRLSDAHQNLDDVEEFMEDDTDFEEGKLETLPRDNLKRKQISL
jgi:hypothetical protein